MGISDVQYCLILLHTLPSSYEVVASTLLTSGPASSLKYSEITARILNEEGRKSGPNTSLNSVKAPIKSGKKKKKDHSDLTCHYCNKKGHIQPDCRKKKKDEADKANKEKGEGSSADSGKKAANSHVLVPTSTSIEEVNDSDIEVALCTAERERWMMDSGTTHHMSPYKPDFADYAPCQGSVSLGDKSSIGQIGVGSIYFKTCQGAQLTLTNVLRIPELKTRFLSMRALVQRGATGLFDRGTFQIAVNQRCIARGYLENNLYWLDTRKASLNAHMRRAATLLHVWHQHMGHMSHMALKTHGPAATLGMDINTSPLVIPYTCHGCKMGKSTHKPFSGSGRKTECVFEVVHSDLASPMQTKSLQGSSYIATFVDDYSWHAVVYFIKSKDLFVSALQKFLAWGETQTTHKLKALHSDRGGEYLAGAVTTILNEKGIERHLTMPGSPQQNGKAERFNRTIMEKAMVMLHAAAMSSGFWEYTVQTTVHVYNRSPTRTLGWRMLHKIWSPGQVPDISYFHIFGCLGYMHVPIDKHRKLDAKAIEVMLVGYELGSKGYWLWDRHTHSLRLLQDVTFDESIFPFKQGDLPYPAPMPPAPLSVQAPYIPSPAPTVPNPPALPPVLLPVSTTITAPVLPTSAPPVVLPASPPLPVQSTDSEAIVQGLLRPDTECNASPSTPVQMPESALADTPHSTPSHSSSVAVAQATCFF
jgi:transposase InsO family protein